ncbi:general odorant-binding protein 70 [Phlebotomus argentipes]|uniref:general odorant-binding protein 70 n=1 Tax=Phlebotomus argentipes TaxID=94469 RepID=UPI002892F1EE|nr:general odorant-binding protein 70 [Phlebotomus argentipes]
MRLSLVILVLVSTADGFFIHFLKKAIKCRRLPSVDKRIEAVLGECKEEVSYEFARENLQLFSVQPQLDLAAQSIQRLDTLRRSKRDAEEFQHPNTVTPVERRLAGCLLRCFYKRNKALNYFGYPTLYGLVQIYTDGVDDHEYFMAVLRAAEQCITGVAHKYANSVPIDRESCDVAFDVFDCLHDKITEYCSDHQLPANDFL